MSQQRAYLADTGAGQLGDRRQCLAALLHPCNRRRGFRAMVDALAVGLSANLVTALGQPLGLPGVYLTDLAHRDHQRRGVIDVRSFPLCARLIGTGLGLTNPPPRFDLRGISSYVRTIGADGAAGPPPQPHSFHHVFLATVTHYPHASPALTSRAAFGTPH